MLREGQLGLQIFRDHEWRWVFCYNLSTGIVITGNARKALSVADQPYFERHFGNDQFRAWKVT